MRLVSERAGVNVTAATSRPLTRIEAKRRIVTDPECPGRLTGSDLGHTIISLFNISFPLGGITETTLPVGLTTRNPPKN